MKVILDDRVLTQEPTTLAQAIDMGVDAASSGGRVIVDILADGRSLSTAELDDPDTMAYQASEVRLTSAEPRAFVRTTLLDASEALDEARNAQIDAADLIEAGSITDAYDSINTSLSLWQAARQALDQGAQLLGLDLTTLPADDVEQLPDAIATLTTALEEVRRSIAHQDWAALGDVLRYDLDELVTTWQRLLSHVAQHIASSHEKG